MVPNSPAQFVFLPPGGLRPHTLWPPPEGTAVQQRPAVVYEVTQEFVECRVAAINWVAQANAGVRYSPGNDLHENNAGLRSLCSSLAW